MLPEIYSMWKHLKEKGIKLPKITAEQINAQIEPVLREMEKVGVKIDVKSLNDLSKKLESELSLLQKSIFDLCDGEFNLNSPNQLAEILFEKLKIPSSDLKKTKSGISTAASELRKIEDKHPVITKIIRYREIQKLISTYLTPLPLLVDKDFRLHTTYGQDTQTSRLTSSEPNLQNIPIKGEIGPQIRQSFIAKDGCSLVSADYSQIELRIVAVLADDRNMLASFKNGEDIHAHTASEIFKKNKKDITKDERRFAKVINFGILYGMSPYGLSQALGIGQSAAAEYIFRYMDSYKGIKNYAIDIIEKAKKLGYVETLFGFRRYLQNINERSSYLSDSDERIAINTPVQGTAAELIKLAMIKLSKELKKLQKQKNIARLILTVHDELVVECSDSIAKQVASLVKKTMENVVTFPIKIEVEVGIGKNWSESK
mgnify:CR=1 FL=1